MKPLGEYGRFRNPMDEDALVQRLILDDNAIYRLAQTAAGHQSAYTVDRLSWKLKAVLPRLIAKLAAEVEHENAEADRALEVDSASRER